jgi:predicted transcriptional regulator
VARVNGRPIRIQQILPMAKAALDRVSVAERDRKKPDVLRRALLEYVDRELLLQEAIARGVQADSREVDWVYDQMRREHADDRAWSDFLAGQGMDAPSLRVELRARHTVDALLDREAAGRPAERAEVQAALLARLRARARIELYL